MFIDTAFLSNDEIKLVLEKTVDGNAEKDWVPAYHFAICNPQGVKMGVCDLRIGHNDKLYYGGNIGYSVEEIYRGHHYAGKACLMLFELAKQHKLEYVIKIAKNLKKVKVCENCTNKKRTIELHVEAMVLWRDAVVILHLILCFHSRKIGSEMTKNDGVNIITTAYKISRI